MAQHQLQHIIDNAWDNRANISADNATHELREAVEHVLNDWTRDCEYFTPATH